MADIKDHAGNTVISFDDAFESDGSLGASDGTLDFAGPSGVTVNDTATGSFSYTLSSGTDDLSAFIGTGTVLFDIMGEATSY